MNSLRTFAAGLPAVPSTARLFASRRPAAEALWDRLSGIVLLLLTPNYYCQMFNNPKDIPFAVGGVWATYYIVRLLPSLPRPPWRLLVKLGLAIGLAMGVRVGGLLFLCYLALIVGLWGIW